MGEEKKPEEPKVEDAKPEEKNEEKAKAEEKPPVEEEKEDPKPPSPFILLSVDLHCVGCAKKIQKSLLRIRGVVGVDIDTVKNQVTIKGVVEPEAVCNKIMKKTKRSAKVLSPVPAAEGEPIPQPVASQVPGLTTVELNVNMHCEACAQQLRRMILKMKGVSTVETELSSGKVTVTGTMDGEKLVEYVYRRTKKQAKIVPQPEPEAQPEEEAKAEEKAVEEAKPEDQEKKEEEKPAEEGKTEGGGDEKKEEETKKEMNVVSSCDEQSMQRMMYYYQYPPLYVMERIPPPQLFSDENPNACSIS